MEEEGPSPSAWGHAFVADIAQVLIIFPGSHGCLGPRIREKGGRRQKGKGYHSFKVTCPGGKPWDISDLPEPQAMGGASWVDKRHWAPWAACPYNVTQRPQSEPMGLTDTTGSCVSQLHFLRAGFSPFPWLWFL
jgi:hypothetical protein